MAGDRELSLGVGMNDHVTKPIDPDVLFAVLLKWIKSGERQPDATTLSAPSDRSAQPAPARPGPGELPGIDRVTGLKRVAGNEKLYRKLLLDFHRDFADAVERVRIAMAESRLTDAERQVHTLKGVAGNIGAMDLHRSAQELDSALRVNALGKAEGLLPDVERALSVVIQGLEPLAHQAEAAQAEARSSEAPTGAGVDSASLEAALRELSNLLRKNDPEAETALERVRGALRGTRGPDVERVARALDMFDFREATKALSALAEAVGIGLG
jgi:two-component system, sensor histidine kinase and response regulator